MDIIEIVNGSPVFHPGVLAYPIVFLIMSTVITLSQIFLIWFVYKWIKSHKIEFLMFMARIFVFKGK